MKNRQSIFSCGLILSSLLLVSFSYSITSLPTIQAQERVQSSSTTQSAISEICQLVQDNALLSSIAGFGEAVAVCTGLDTIDANQALSDLCAAVYEAGLVDAEQICRNQGIESTTLNQESTNNTLNNNREATSDSLVEDAIGLLT